MRRRFCLVLAALSIGAMAFGAVGAAAATKKSSGKTKSFKPVAKATCKTNTGITVAQGDSSVTPPVSQGSEYGTSVCGKVLGRGVQADTFNVPLSGDDLAKYTMFFPTGTIHGKYDLTPQEGSFSNFDESDYVGTLTILGGTGAYQGAKGIGTMTCTSLDGIHTTCTDHLKFKAL